MNFLSPALAWALLGEIAIVALIAVTIAFWRARRRYRQRYEALERLLNRMVEGQEKRVARKAEWLQSSRGLSLFEARDAAERSAAAEREFLRSLLQPVLTEISGFPEDLDQLLYRFSDEQMDALLQAAASKPLPAGPDSDLLNLEEDDDAVEEVAYQARTPWAEEEDTPVLEAPRSGGNLADAPEPDAELLADGPELPYAGESNATEDEDIDALAGEPSEGIAPAETQALDDEMPMAADPATWIAEDDEIPDAGEVSPSPQDDAIETTPNRPRTQEEIDADIAASLRELEAAMGDAGSSESGLVEDAASPAEAVEVLDTGTLESSNSSVEDDADTSEEGQPDDPFEPDDASLTTADGEPAEVSSEPGPKSDETAPSDLAEDELDSLLSGPWTRPDAEVDLAPGLIEVEEETTAVPESDETTPSGLKSDSEEAPVDLAQSMESLLTDLWSDETPDTGLADQVPSPLASEVDMAEIAGPANIHPETSESAPDPDQSQFAEELESESLAESEGTELTNAEPSMDLPELATLNEQSQATPETPPDANGGIKAETVPLEASPTGAAPKKRTSRKSKPRSKQKQDAETPDAPGDPG